MFNYYGFKIRYGHDVTQGGHFLEVEKDGVLVDAYHTHPAHDDYTYTLIRADKLAKIMADYNVPRRWIKAMLKKENKS